MGAWTYGFSSTQVAFTAIAFLSLATPGAFSLLTSGEVEASQHRGSGDGVLGGQPHGARLRTHRRGGAKQVTTTFLLEEVFRPRGLFCKTGPLNICLSAFGLQ